MNSKIWTAVVTLISLSITTCQTDDLPCVPVRVRECPGVVTKADLVAVYIQDCITAPCSFKKGRNVTMEMDIKFKEPVERLEAQLHALIGNLPIKWDGVNPDACQDILSKNDCPFDQTDFVTYGVKLGVSSAYPTISTDVRYSLLDSNGDYLICWIVRASVQDP